LSERSKSRGNKSSTSRRDGIIIDENGLTRGLLRKPTEIILNKNRESVSPGVMSRVASEENVLKIGDYLHESQFISQLPYQPFPPPQVKPSPCLTFELTGTDVHVNKPSIKKMNSTVGVLKPRALKENKMRARKQSVRF